MLSARASSAVEQRDGAWVSFLRVWLLMVMLIIQCGDAWLLMVLIIPPPGPCRP